MINLFMLRNRLYSDYNLTDFSVTVTYYDNGLQEKRFDSLNYTEWWGFLQEYGARLVTRFTVDLRDDVKHIDIYFLAEERKNEL